MLINRMVAPATLSNETQLSARDQYARKGVTYSEQEIDEFGHGLTRRFVIRRDPLISSR